MNRRSFAQWLGCCAAAFAFALPQFALADEAPDAFIKRLSDEVLGQIRSDEKIRGGDIGRILSLVDSKVMPNVDFARMTAATVGPSWRQATPEQKQKLQDEFKTLLVRTYAGALAQVNDQTISVKPMRAAPEDTEVVVRTEVRGRGDPIQLDYRLEKTAGQGAGWKIYNLNVLGVWLVETYRSQFSEVTNTTPLGGSAELRPPAAASCAMVPGGTNRSRARPLLEKPATPSRGAMSWKRGKGSSGASRSGGISHSFVTPPGHSPVVW